MMLSRDGTVEYLNISEPGARYKALLVKKIYNTIICKLWLSYTK